MIQEEIHKKILAQCEKVSDWFEEKQKGLKFPIYSSFDIRDSGWKVAPVDANIFPAGFNNICSVDKENAPALVKNYMDSHYPQVKGRIAILSEEHSSNSYYWENVASLKEIFVEAGYDTLVCIPSEMSELKTLTTPKGVEVQINGSLNKDGEILLNDKKVDLIICNNDFSDSYDQWSDKLVTPMNPPRQLGWYQRRKHDFFKQYNKLSSEFAQIIGVNSADLKVETELFSNFDTTDSESLDRLAQHVDQFLAQLKTSYKQRGIEAAPFCFIKNNMGTYGLAVTQVHSGSEVLEWNNKTRKKMKAAKGGRDVDEVIIQEGIPTRFKDDAGATAEPCIYMFGNQLVGGFLRTHSSKTEEESLNSPGAVFKRLCMSDLVIDQPGCPMENVYGWTSRLSALAIANEAKLAGVEFKGYQN